MHPLITVDELAASDGIVVCDLRWDLTDPGKGSDTYEDGHVPDAVFVDLDADLAATPGIDGRHPLPTLAEFAATLGRIGVRPESHVVAYDDAAGRIAARLWWMLRSIGHERVQVLDGGFQRWVGEGHPVETGWVQPFPAHYREPGGWTGVVSHDDLDNITVVDARAPARYRGEIEPVDLKAGHIPGAINLPADENLDESGRFLAADTLAARFGNLPDQVAVSCGSGVTACHDALAMVVAGLTMPLVYVGLVSEWSRRDLPVFPRTKPLITHRADEAIESSDTDELIRVIDGLCAAALWGDLVELKERCSEAVGRGKQLWGVEEHIRYRLALEAPGPWSGAAVSEGGARFALGPLPEVAASTKTWAELSPHLENGPWRGVVAAERTIRGEETDEVADLPGRLLPWEPRYPVATYKADKVEAPSPTPPPVQATELPDTASPIDDPQSEAGLTDLVQAWVTESNGRATTVTVDGDALCAIRALGLRTARTAALDTAEGLAWLAWAGASGGAHGRRRGAAAGRYGAWWAIATICDLDWPVEPEPMTRAVTRLEFVWFDDGSPGTGWELRLAIADPDEGLAWAISAVDQSD